MQTLTQEDFWGTTKTEQNLTHTPITPAEQQRQERIDTLMDLLFTKNIGMKKACDQIGISRTTGYEYFKTWQETEESQLVDTEFWALYEQVKQEDPSKALEILSKIKVKKMAVKAEIVSKNYSVNQTDININMDGLSAEEQNAIINAGRILIKKTRGTEQSSSIH